MALRRLAVVVAVLASLSAIALLACDDGGSAVKEQSPTLDSGAQPTVDSGGTPPITDGGPTLPDGAPSDCYLSPKTHLEIINACTDAVKLTKNPTLPLLYPDGGLPPLP